MSDTQTVDPLADALEAAGYQRTSGTVAFTSGQILSNINPHRTLKYPWPGPWPLRALPTPTDLEKQTVTMRDVLHAVASRHEMRPAELMGASRHKMVVRARQEAFAEMRRRGRSLAEIGRFFERDHTTVLYGLRKHEQRIKRVDAST